MAGNRRDRRAGRMVAGVCAGLLALVPFGVPVHGAAPDRTTGGSALYFVRLDGAPLALRHDSGRSAAVTLRGAQEPAIATARRLGGSIAYRYMRAVNGFSARLSHSAARELAGSPGVAAVEPVPVVRAALSDSVRHIGTKHVWSEHGAKGKGVHVAVIDSGIDYTHKAFRGRGTSKAYNGNDPTKIEGNSFPTSKVVAGHDFVGDAYDVLDNKASNDVPNPDPDPLDPQGHGTHVAGTCCGKWVKGIGKGLAPKAKLHAYKVWGNGGSSTADVLVAAYERALDPNQDGDLRDKVDVVNFSGGVYYGTPTSTESMAARALVDAGVMFVAAAGNSAGHAYRIGAPAAAPGVLSVSATELPIDRVAGFSSPGPARGGHGFKPEVSAPGEAIYAPAVGSGSGGIFLSGTSMAAPHVAGAAALLVDLHPHWTPAQLGSALINHSTPAVSGRGADPGPAILAGAGRVRVDHAADAVSLAVPSTVSFGAAHTGSSTSLLGEPFRIVNKDRRGHRYRLSTSIDYASVDPQAASVSLSIDGDPFSDEVSFWVKPKSSELVVPRLQLEPGLLSDADEAMVRFGRLPVIDGSIIVKQRRNGRDGFQVPWLVVPYASSAVASAQQQADLSSGSETLDLDVTPSAGTAAADLYVFGDDDPSGDVPLAEADVELLGARSFTGTSLGDGPTGLPQDTDPFRGDDWLSAIGAPSIEEPVEVVIATSGIHETLETLRVRILIDAGADGVFADPALGADYVVEKRSLSQSGCVRTAPLTSNSCDGDVGVDGDIFDSDLVALVFDALDVGLSDGDPTFSYRVEVCSDTFSGDVPELLCDTSAGVGPGGTYSARLDVTDPSPLPESPFCGGFWSTSDCRSGLELLGAPSDPDVLLIFPNNPPGSSAQRIATP